MPRREMRCASPCSPPGGSTRSAVAHCRRRNLVRVRVRVRVWVRVWVRVKVRVGVRVRASRPLQGAAPG